MQNSSPTHCLLVNPSTPTTSQLPFFNDVTSTPPIGLGYIAGYLLERDISLKIIDEMVTPLNETFLENEVKKLAEPRIVGFSCMTLNSVRVYELARQVKFIDPKAQVFIGGIHPTVLPEEGLGMEQIDGVVRGEAEITFYEIVTNILKGKSLVGIKGLSIKENGSVHVSPDRELTKNLDDIPPFPYHLFDDTYHLYSTFANIISTRGCPFDCIFCSQRSMTQRKFRAHSIERIVADIELLITKYNQRVITFSDDMVLSNKRFFLRLMDRFIELGFAEKAEFSIQARSDYIDEEVVRKMKEANVSMLSFGVETGSQRLTDLIQKEEKIEDHIRAINIAAKGGLNTNGVFIFGFPTETRQDRRETIRFARSLPLGSVRFNTLVPYPGTKVYRMAKEENRLLIKKKWENFSVQYYILSNDIPYVPEGNSRYEVILDTMVANLSFYAHPRNMFRILFGKNKKYGAVININKTFSLKKKLKMLLGFSRFGFLVARRLAELSTRVTFNRFFS